MQSKNSIQTVNILFLFVLCLETANLLFTWLPQYVRLNLNEALFVFLPDYLFLRIIRQPVAEQVRWRWPGWKAALLSLLAGLGLYPFTAVSAAVLTSLLGYQGNLAAADAIPTTPLMAVLAIVALAVMAPLCEEFLFRGVIQPVYEKRGPHWTVLFVGFLFIIFHLSLLQGLSIILLALMLGFVNFRTRSLPASNPGPLWRERPGGAGGHPNRVQNRDRKGDLHDARAADRIGHQRAVAVGVGETHPARA